MARADIARYMIALAVLAMMTIASFVVMRNLIAEIHGTEAMVTHASEMRSDLHKTKMAAQDLISHLQEMREMNMEMSAQDHPEHLNKNLHHATSALSARLELLLSAVTNYGAGPEIWVFMRDEPYRLELETRDLITFAKQLNMADSHDDIDMASMRALGLAHMAHSDPNNGVDRLIEYLRNDIATTISNTTRLHDALGFATLLVLAIEALIIFRPLINRLRHESSRAAEAESELAYLASHDALTGLHNRITFERALEAKIKRSEQEDGELAVILVDLDDFKPINDTFGHAAGDKMLKTVAQSLISSREEGELVARLGGDEFVIAWSCANIKAVHERATMLLSSLHQPVEIAGRQLSIGASLGIALANRNGRTVSELLAAADHAMYAAKRAGKNDVIFFDPAINRAGNEREAAILELRRAFNQDEFILHYQPVLDHHSGTTFGYEALVRWKHPTRGLMPPGEFLPTIENCGMMIDLTDVVLDRALRRAAEWREATGTCPFMSVNIPQDYLLLTDLSDRIISVLSKHKLPTDALMIEVVETVTLGPSNRAVERALARLKAIGVRIAFDDFGVSQASLIDLRLLAVDTIKIDRQFVEDLSHRPEVQKLVRGIVAMANALGKSIVVEGVETEEQHRLLNDCSDIMVQGFYYARPSEKPDMPSDANTKMRRLEVVS